MKSVFNLAENLSLVLTKLDAELGLAQPQLVIIINTFSGFFWFGHIDIAQVQKGFPQLQPKPKPNHSII